MESFKFFEYAKDSNPQLNFDFLDFNAIMPAQTREEVLDLSRFLTGCD